MCEFQLRLTLLYSTVYCTVQYTVQCTSVVEANYFHSTKSPIKYLEQDAL
jgi:hypothetical protein